MQLPNLNPDHPSKRVIDIYIDNKHWRRIDSETSSIIAVVGLAREECRRRKDLDGEDHDRRVYLHAILETKGESDE